MRDAPTMDLLAARGIPLEVCPTSNLRTGALARQLGCDIAGYQQHPLASFFRRGLPVTLSSDDPAMFETTISTEYLHAHDIGLAPVELVQIAEASFQHAFLPIEGKNALLNAFHSGTTALGLV
jgi:adenosine deaminase